MKKYNLYLWFIALVGLITSCSQDEAAGPQNDVSNRVRIGASIEQAVQTRAASVTIPGGGYYLRYVLEVWSTGGTSSLIYKNEKTTADATAVEFTFDLSTAGDYKVLLWADFVTDGTGTPVGETGTTHYNDKHYTTTSLKEVALAGTYTVNDESRDAFFACETITKKEGALNESITLTRPFGQINIIEKNTELLDKVESIALNYKVPDVFNVEDGATTGTKAVSATVSTLPESTNDRKANLFYDFIFAPESGQKLLEKIDMKFTSSDPTVTLNNFEIPANMPAERNKRTNISGSILHTSTVPDNTTKLSVTVDDTWTMPIEEDIDPKVGDYYYKDGTWSAEIKNIADNPIIGVVTKVYSSDDSRYGKARGKVISLKEKSLQWATTFEDVETDETKGGKENTDYIIANYSLDEYPIFKACNDLRTETGKDWYIPTPEEYTLDIFSLLSNFNSKIETAEGVQVVIPTGNEDAYWTCFEGDQNFGKTLVGKNHEQILLKTQSHKVRFILEF